jgi:fatty acid desaturase
MPPNARPNTTLIFETEPLKDALTEMLDMQQADTDGPFKINGNKEDWTDVKHSERKKRDRILDGGVLIKLMKKSDYEGFKRLFTNLGVMALTAYGIQQMNVFPLNDQSFTVQKLAVFLPVYFFYGFQFQCFAFAGQHEFLHRNAFKTKWVNDLCLFFTGVFCFELGVHERVMHKQHHTYTNHIDKDPELTSYFTREELENPGFRNLPSGRVAYVRQFFDFYYIIKCRAGRILNSAMGIAVDYSGTGWSLKEWTYSDESGIMQTLQMTALAQIASCAAMFLIFGQTKQGLQALFFWWIAPVLCGHPVVNYFRNLEHADCEVSKDINCLRNTRSVRSNIITRTLLWDTNFHAEHHCYPMVPFFNLHKINELMHPYVIHNEKDHFTTQNWAAFKPGGWIDQQAERVEAYRSKIE